MATVAKVVEMAATRLGIFGEGETLSSRINADLTQAYSEVHAQLAAINSVDWDRDEDVPDEYTTDVTTLVAAARVNDYGIPNDRYKRIIASATLSLANIRVLGGTESFKRNRVEYF